MPEKAIVFVFRQPGSVGFSPFKLFVNGYLIGAIPPNTFARFELDPGQYRFDFGDSSLAPLSAQLEPGENYFLQYDIALQGAYYSAQLRPVPDDAGKQAVLAQHLIEHSNVDSRFLKPLKSAAGTARGHKNSGNPALLDDYRQLLIRDN